MKKLLFVISISLIVLSSCSKNSSNTKPPNPNSVAINGNSYTTVVIGKQTWTEQNYHSSDTVNFKGADFYTLTQAEAINLPTGWRLPNQNDYNSLLIAAGGSLDPFFGTVTN